MRLFVKVAIAACLFCGAAFTQERSREEIEAKIRELEQKKLAEYGQGQGSESKKDVPVPANTNTPPNYTGDGGKGISLTIYVPQSAGLAKDQSYIPALVQGEFVSNFSNYSAISILDWERLDDIYVKLVNEAYDDKAAAKQDVVLGRLAPTSHFLTGNITKTATGYNIKMNITATADKMTTATYSGTFSFAELDNLTGVRRASLELLQKVGVELTEKARQELAGAAEANQVLAQTALARGVTAQRAGTEVAALSYYFQAASFDPALKEAVKRSLVVAANISSGNIGADIRNDILWRKKWVEKLKETEEFFYGIINAADPPYTLVYFKDIKTGNIDYKTETAELSVTTSLNTNGPWFTAMRRTLEAAQAVLDGLNGTNRKNDWKLDGWPGAGVSNTNPFASGKEYDMTVVFQLVNQQGRVIGNSTVKLKPYVAIGTRRGRFTVSTGGDGVGTLSFKGVKANDISDNLIIRVATVNGVSPQKARFAVTAMSELSEKMPPFTDIRDGKKYNVVRIGGKAWMAENLSYVPQTGNSWCYDNDNSYCDKYGRFYDWNTANTVCPSGWHLPTKEEWEELVSLTGEKAGKKLRATSGWDDNIGTDEYGFSALPTPSRSYMTGKYLGSSYWWTASISHCHDSYPWAKSLLGGNERVLDHCGSDKNKGFSVRCRED
ncbi:MAG: fibrobacter succinogenes major paralogous domain-containing protein [Chitinispirillales bacterium]|jgi:uncharacterized protein (TIGR02145 family)|nr:fibrobacter succinogenes major paralogous domain-containing protein [Chitinispirillales bacterium]